MRAGLRALLAHQWRRHRVVFVLVPAGLALFQFLVTRVAPSPAQTAQFSAIIAYMPAPALQALGLEDAGSLTARGVLAFGYVHPFVIALLGLWTVRVGAGGMAGEIGGRTMDLVASRPVGRTAIVLSVAILLAVGILAAALAGFAGTALGVATRDLGAVRLWDFAKINAGLALLFAGWAGLTLLVSAAYRHGGGAIALVSGAIAVTFALDYLGKAWPPLHPLRPLSPFAYFEPTAMLRSGFAPHAVPVLGGMALIGLLGAVVVFRYRDL